MSRLRLTPSKTGIAKPIPEISRKPKLELILYHESSSLDLDHLCLLDSARERRYRTIFTSVNRPNTIKAPRTQPTLQMVKQLPPPNLGTEDTRNKRPRSTECNDMPPLDGSLTRSSQQPKSPTPLRVPSDFEADAPVAA